MTIFEWSEKDYHVNRPHIALCMMLKNEEATILRSLRSVEENIQTVILFDTGSEDKTLNLASKFCRKKKLKLFITKGLFIDFSTSRNVLMEYADTIANEIGIDWLLLLDANDELKTEKQNDYLRRLCYKLMRDESFSSLSGFLCLQHWKIAQGNHLHYYNIRLLRPNKGWRFRKPVHEYIYNTIQDEPQQKIEGFEIFQDRTLDFSSTNRFARDEKILLREIENAGDEPDPRDIYYLAQTYECLGDHASAYHWFCKRAECIGFWEEKFAAMIKASDYAKELDMPWSIQMDWLNRAIRFSSAIYGVRVEPLIRIARYYMDQGHFHIAYLYAKMACDLPRPGSNIFLFVEKEAYDYIRWNLLGRIGYYVKKFRDGRWACLNAIRARNIDEDKDNLKFYTLELCKQEKNEELMILKEKENEGEILFDSLK